jgi:hypothetical protein
MIFLKLTINISKLAFEKIPAESLRGTASLFEAHFPSLVVLLRLAGAFVQDTYFNFNTPKGVSCTYRSLQDSLNPQPGHSNTVDLFFRKLLSHIDFWIYELCSLQYPNYGVYLVVPTLSGPFL